MKKSLLIFLLITLIIANVFLFPEIKAQDTNASPSSVDSGMQNVQKFNEVSSNLITEENKTAYLKKEWTNILKKTKYIGPVVTFIEKLDPVSNFLLGIPITVSWFFFLTLIIWITFIVVIFRVTSLFEISNKMIFIGAAILISAIITYYRYPKSIAGVIIASLIIITTWWVQLIIISIIVLVLILMIIFSKYIKVIFLAMHLKREKEIMELEKEEFKNDVKLLEKFRKDLAK